MRLPALVSILPALALAGCASLLPGADRVEVQQGNVLDTEDIAALEPGMSRAEIRERIGAPVLGESFNRDRWDYIYYQTEAGREAGEVQRLTLHFRGDGLLRVDNRYSPPEPEMPDELPDIPDEGEPAPSDAPAGEQPAPSPSPSPSPSPMPDPGGTGMPGA